LPYQEKILFKLFLHMRLPWLFLLPLLAACNSTPSPVHEGTVSRLADRAPKDTSALPSPDTAATKAVSARGDTLRVVQQRHNFSHPEGPADVFRLVFRGPSVLQGSAEFTITTPEGQVIFREMLTEPDLEASLVYEMTGPAAEPAQREAFVLRRIAHFFDAAQFHTPAVDPKALAPAGGTVDAAAWKDLRQRPDAVRFDYLKGKEDRQQIAWSPLKKQVVRVQ